MSTSTALKQIFAAGRPLVEQWLDIAEEIAALRETATAQGLDWSQVKALLKAQIQDERDESGDGKRVRRIVEKADFASAYADMLGLSKRETGNITENIFSAPAHEPLPPHDPATGEIRDEAEPVDDAGEINGHDEQSERRDEPEHAQVGSLAQPGTRCAFPEAGETAAIIPEDRDALTIAGVSDAETPAGSQPSPQVAPAGASDYPELPSFLDRREQMGDGGRLDGRDGDDDALEGDHISASVRLDADQHSGFDDLNIRQGLSPP